MKSLSSPILPRFVEMKVVKLVGDLQGLCKIAFMKTFIAVALWFILLVLCWPLALLLIFLLPLIWLILLPFRIVGLTLELLFKLIGAVLFFPFRVMGAGPRF